MLLFMNYNFMQDGNALSPLPTSLDALDCVTIQNGIFTHLNITRDTTSDYSSTIPEWDFYTLMDAAFNDNINAGNVDFATSSIDEVRVKRRKIGTYEWIIIHSVPITQTSDLIFVRTDFLNANNTEYEYALVPAMNGVEGNYITASILSQISGVFICDREAVYRFYIGVKYKNAKRVRKSGIFEPLGRAYPIVASNALTNYVNQTIEGTLITDSTLNSGDNIDREAEVALRKNVVDFLTDNKPKVVKDWNGNMWLVSLKGEVSEEFINEIGMAVASVSAEMVEIGDVNSKSDLYTAGLIPTSE